MKMKSMLIIATLIIATVSCKKSKDDQTAKLDDGIYADFTTNYGNFTAKLYYEKAPMTVANFISLAEGTNPKADQKFKGKHFYDGLIFHRIIDGFMIQGGDPDGNGTGGPGYQFPNETDPDLKHDDKGILSMANAGSDTNGSQFFITLAPQPSLDGGYSVFGKIVDGQNIVDSIGKVKTQNRQTNKPVDDVVMQTVRIQRIGDDAQNFDAPKVFQEHVQEFMDKKKAEKEKITKQIDSLAQGFTKTDSGLRYKITKSVASGKKPKSGQTIQVYYKGMLPNGQVFDENKEENQKPLTFDVGTGRVIPGWDEGLQLLKEGEEARLIIPPELAYGERGAGPIPPNSTLIFDVKLAKIEK